MPRPLRRSAVGVLALVLAAAAPWPASAATASTAAKLPNTIDGIDVSKWQTTIDWDEVATTTTRFAILRASRGHNYSDETYAQNLSGASAAGIVVGAYHYATPGMRDGDARREADRFLATARNAAGDLLPVLDIEEANGLSPAEMTTWVRRFVERVRDRTGVRPMLYASPYFWRTRMGNTTWFAERGYPLWIAHWGVTDPDVPADGWAGNGYLVHQWTSSGHVDGVPTRVDRDRFPGSTLRTGRIASVTLTASPGGRVSGPRLSCGTGDTNCARLVNPGDELTLTATPAAGAVVLGWTGDCAAAGTSPTCTLTTFGDEQASAVFGYPLDVAVSGTGAGSVSSAPNGIACGAACDAVFPAGTMVQLAASPDSASAFVEWTGACAGSTPTCAVTMNGPRHVGARFDATTILDQDDTGTSYRWGVVRDSRAIGGRYVSERMPDASATFAFTGGALTLDAIHGPSMGRARVLVDGVQVGTFDGCAARFATRSHRYDGLGAGPHELVVETATTPRSCGTARVGIDALRWDGQPHPNQRPSTATWGSLVDGAAYGGDLVRSDTSGALARLAFTGTGVTLLTVRGPTMGVAALFVDGERAATWDLSANLRSFVRRTVTGLDDTDHTVRLVVTGRSGARGHGRSVAVDGWIVR